MTQPLFVYNIVQTMGGAKKKPRAVATAEATFLLVAVAAAIGLGVVGFFLGRDTAPKQSGGATPTVTVATTAATTTTATTTGGTSTAAAGKVVFTQNCGACHTLKDAGASGAVGPNLDDLKPAAARVAAQVTNGGKTMPSFKATLTPAQIQAVAAYVSQATGGG